MWNKTTDKQNIYLYEDLVERMKNCKTSLIDIMLNSKIFDLLSEKKENSLNLDLI